MFPQIYRAADRSAAAHGGTRQDLRIHISPVCSRGGARGRNLRQQPEIAAAAATPADPHSWSRRRRRRITVGEVIVSRPESARNRSSKTSGRRDPRCRRQLERMQVKNLNDLQAIVPGCCRAPGPWTNGMPVSHPAAVATTLRPQRRPVDHAEHRRPDFSQGSLLRRHVDVARWKC